MKWLLSVTALLVLATGAFGAALVEPDLQRRMIDAGDRTLISVDFYLHDQFDPDLLNSMVDGLPKPIRRARVGRLLMDFAAEHQRDLLSYLEVEQAHGRVAQIHSMWLANMVHCWATPAVIEEVAAREDVALVYYDKVAVEIGEFKGESPAPSDAVEWNVTKVRAPAVWNTMGYTGQNVVVGIIDTGVRYTHLDLRDHLWNAIDTTRATGFPNHGWNFASNQYLFPDGNRGPSSYDSLTPLDYYGHGSHCAGTVASNGSAGDTCGMAPLAKMLIAATDTYIHNSNDSAAEWNTMDGMQFCVRPQRPGRMGPDTLNGADVLTMSLGWYPSWQPRRRVWRTVEVNIMTAGIAHCVAAGNEGTSWIRIPGDCPPPWPNPANHPTDRAASAVITVASTDVNDAISSFSSRRSVFWDTVTGYNDYGAPGLKACDVAAPGSNITSLSYSSDNGYASGWSGTSMATPAVAGCVALMLSKNPMLTPRMIDSVLEMHGVIDLGPTGKDSAFGAGRINCSLAVANTPAPHDVGVLRIYAPAAGNYDSLATATPSAWVRNFHTNASPAFKVRFRIGTWYEDSASVASLPPGDSLQLTFGQWTALERGVLAVKCSTELAFDGTPSNDKVEHPITVIVHDASAGTITVPSGTLDSASTVTPTVIVHNSGTAVENITARLRIGAYNETATATAVPGGDSVELSFPQWQVALRGDQAPTCSTEMTGDVYPSNDKSTGAFFGRVHDVAAAEILAPSGRVNPNIAVAPLVLVRNTGTDEISCNVRLEISTGYAFTQTVNNIPAETDTVIEFATWLASPPGVWQTSAQVTASGDMIAANDLFVDSVRVGDPVPPGWSEITPSVPSSPSGRAVKDGGWLVYDPLSATFYAAKGYKTGDFYQYDPVAGAWLTKPSMPNGIEAKPPYKGAVGCADGLGNIYATKGNNTSGFWKYNTADSTWTQLADLPLGLSNKKVKGGTDLVYFDHGDSQYVYALKGYKTEFYRYNTVSGAWYTLADAPAGAKPKWDKGSFLVLDEANRRLYAHKAKYSEMYTYSLDSSSWGGLMAGIPTTNQQTGKNKKAKDGSDGAMLDGIIYALKGGNTGEFFTYDPATAAWAEAPLVPEFGSTGKKKRVKAGGSLASDGEAVYALKGNKTLEFWVYTLGTGDAWRPAPQRDGVLAGRQDRRSLGITLRPNPLRSGLTTVGYSLPAAGPLCIRVYDVTGRELVTSSSIAGRFGAVSLDLRGLSAGIYLVRLEATGYVTTSKLVVER